MFEKVNIVIGLPEHARFIGLNIRDADRLELEGIGTNPISAVAESFQISDKVWTAMLDDVPICIFGVASIEMADDKAIAWLLGTDTMQWVKKDFLRISSRMLPKLMDGYKSLENFVDERNEQSIKWLEWLGFQFIGAYNIGVNGEPYLHYRLEKENV